MDTKADPAIKLAALMEREAKLQVIGGGHSLSTASECTCCQPCITPALTPPPSPIPSLQGDIEELTGKVERASGAFAAAGVALEGLEEEALQPHGVLTHLVAQASAAAVAEEPPR
jgi:hypothetical protein